MVGFMCKTVEQISIATILLTDDVIAMLDITNWLLGEGCDQFEPILVFALEGWLPMGGCCNTNFVCA